MSITQLKGGLQIKNSTIVADDLDTTGSFTVGAMDIENTTASSATEGGNLRLSCDDGAVMAASHRLGVVEFAGAEDASSTITVGARIEAIADATWSSSENGANLDFYTTDGDASQTKRMTILATGEIGIGDSVYPGTLLQVEGTAPYLTLKNSTSENSDGGCESKIIFEDHSNTTLAQIQGSHDGSSDDTKGDLIFSTHNGTSLVEVARFDAAGKLTCTSPNDTVAKFESTDAGSAIVLEDNGSTNNGNKIEVVSDVMRLYTAGSERVRIDSGGHVGIGVSPSVPLHVLNSLDYVAKFESTDSYAAIVIEDNSSTNNGNLIAVTGDNMRLYTAGSERMRIDSSGDVGIGTTTPDCTLNVAGGFAASGPSKTFQTFASGDYTPSVANGNLFKTYDAAYQGATSFDDGVAGQIVTIISTNEFTYMVSGGNLKGGTTNITTAAEDVTTWVYDGTYWYLMNFMDQSADLSGGH